MEILGLSGYARSGKDEAARVLVEEFGFIRVAFADKLREVLYALNPIVDTEWYPLATPKKAGHWYVQDVIDQYGWDGYKETRFGAEIRRLLQRLGTEAGRQTLWDSIWIDAALTNLPSDAKVVVPDCRFENEALAITEGYGGQVWRINRRGIDPATADKGEVHSSETSLDNWCFDAIIENNASLEAFQRNIKNHYRYSQLGAGARL